MLAEPALRGAHDARRFFGAQAHVAGTERHDEVFTKRPLAVGDGLVDDQADAQVALHACRERIVGSVDRIACPLHVVHQIGEHDLLDTGLAQRRQHTLDVAQEYAVGPDDQHALIFQRETIRVEQVGSAVQRDDGLAGAGTTLHHQHAGLWAADDLVLLALDGGDDVAQLAGAATFESGEQRAVATDAVGSLGGLSDVVVLGPDAKVTLAEQFVLQAQQLPAVHVEVPPAHQAQRVAAGGTVERLGHGGTPVDHHGVAVLVGDGQPADVKALERDGIAATSVVVARPVDTAEHEGGIAQVELRQPVEHRLVVHIALVAGLKGTAEGALMEPTHLPRVDFALLEAVIGVVDERLLSSEIWVMLRHMVCVCHFHGARNRGLTTLSALVLAATDEKPLHPPLRPSWRCHHRRQ